MVTYYGDIGFTRQANLVHVMECFLDPLDLSNTSLSKKNIENIWGKKFEEKANCPI